MDLYFVYQNIHDSIVAKAKQELLPQNRKLQFILH